MPVGYIYTGMVCSEIEPMYTLAENTGACALGLSRYISTLMESLNGDPPSSYEEITFNNTSYMSRNLKFFPGL